ncbi:tellurium resistance protein [Frigidibacter albus]|uniref:Tellurium resistance protein n=1 Tax=Frigidibacter albus TaxID=1465486 RepID=A0A6L8VDJ5_9RHOB|nr:tellurium resistance protein [Frigidibacter albus]MZQ88367.1 tellurium resistance protein [Frigidibacter albus]NBE29959.1 tellurium resistance protein [Frigidibacter albus]GGH45808.1 tellurium resistance protein [Frigidibacter albus]
MAFKAPTPTPPGLWRRTPPAVFPPILGLLGLGLAWRAAGPVFGVPAGLGEALLGAVTLLWLLALLAYGAKIARRPGVVAEDLRVLPGRSGLAAAVLCLYGFALVLAPYAPEQARPVLLLALVAHGAMLAVLLRVMAGGPPEQRQVTPVWHLQFTGFVVAALAAVALGMPGLAQGLFWLALVAAVAVWGLSAAQFAKARVPAPLRPLLAIHLAPAGFLGAVALGLGWDLVAAVFAFVAAGILLALLAAGRWLTAAGFTPLWSAFTFPLASAAGLWLALAVDEPGWLLPGGLALVATTLVIPPIAFRVMKMWAAGQLAVKTNAAVA